MNHSSEKSEERERGAPRRFDGSAVKLLIGEFERGNSDQLREAFSAVEELLKANGKEVRELVGLSFLPALHDAASWRFSSEVFERFLGPETRCLWAELDGLWKKSIMLNLLDRSVLEEEVTTWRIVRQALR